MCFLQGFGMARVLRITQLEPNHPDLTRVENVNYVGKKTCLVCGSISTTKTFTTEACQETFAIQKGPLNCDSEKVLLLLKWKVCGEVPQVGIRKIKFHYRFNSYKSKHRAFRKGKQKVPQKRFHAHYSFDGHSGIDDCNFVFFEQCETYEQLKERETFWQNRLKTFYSIGLNEKEEYLY